MRYEKNFEDFCLALNLIWGRPKGLGSAQQRLSTQVGGKKGGPIRLEELTADDWKKIIALAEQYGLGGTPEKFNALYQEYQDWYTEQRRRCP